MEKFKLWIEDMKKFQGIVESKYTVDGVEVPEHKIPEENPKLTQETIFKEKNGQIIYKIISNLEKIRIDKYKDNQPIDSVTLSNDEVINII